MDEISVLQLSRYDRLGGSSRLRFYDYQPELARHGIHVTAAPFFDAAYLKSLYAGKRMPADRIYGYYRHRIATMRSRRRYDVIWLEKEALPWCPGPLELTLLRGTPYVIDFDDAWFHRYDQHRTSLVRGLLGGKFPTLVRHAAAVIAGSPYLAEWAESHGARKVMRIPTTVDLTRYSVRQRGNAGSFVIGWIGSPSTTHYLKLVADALPRIEEATVHLMGSGPIDMNTRVVTVPWSEDTETAVLAGFDVGIMPLTADMWSEGKCAYKLIQYMAAGLPVVASPVGMNREVVQHGVNGFLAQTTQEWITALQTLQGDPELRRRMGAAGRRIVEERYTLQGNGGALAQTLRDAAGQAFKPKLRRDGADYD